MTIKEVSALETFSFFESNANSLYIDVRTVGEFSVGRPKIRCANIPVLFKYPKSDKILENSAFQQVVDHTINEKDIVTVGSEHNARAQQAAKILLSSGFSKIWLLVDGHVGWIKAGMPVTKNNRDGVSYASLLTSTRRSKK